MIDSNRAETASKPLDQQTVRMLQTLSELGMGKQGLSALLPDLRAEHHHFLTGPVVQHRSDWQADTPRWLFDAVVSERLDIVLREHEQSEVGWQVGPAEITAVMYPATMEAPLAREYADIYLWASAHANAKHYDKSLEEIWSAVGGQPVTDDEVTQPSGRLYQDYRALSSDIRSRVTKAGKERYREQRKETRQAGKTSGATKKPQVLQGELSLTPADELVSRAVDKEMYKATAMDKLKTKLSERPSAIRTPSKEDPSL